MTLRALIPFVVVVVALGQVPLGPPNRPAVPGGAGMPMLGPDIGALKAYLNLTDAQVHQMRQAGEQARKQAAEKVGTFQPQIRDKRLALRDLLAKGSSDPAALGKLVLDIQALHKQVREAREAVRTSQLNLLTAEQKAKFKAIEDAAALPAATRAAIRLGLVPRPQGALGLGLMRRGAGLRRQGGPVMEPGPGMMQPGPGMMGPGAGFRRRGRGSVPMDETTP
jgi:Spy/CpxP family protein refolding chaperone